MTDSGTVSVAQASALLAVILSMVIRTNQSFTRIGGPVFKPTGWAGYDWDVTSELQASITAGLGILAACC